MKKSRDFILLYPIAALLFALYVLTHPLQCSFYTQKALTVCFKTLIPSLFPFVFASKFIACVMPMQVSQNSVMHFFARLFGVNKILVTGVLLGLFSGFPTGAVYVSQMYERLLCTEKEAKRAVCLSNNCSASFLLNVAGAAVLGSVKYGVLLLICQVMSVISTAQILKLVYGNTFSTEKHKTLPQTSDSPKFSRVFTECIKSSMLSMLFISGFVIFFFMLSSVINDAFLPFLGSSAEIFGVLSGAFFELSTGVLACSGISFPLSVIVCAFCVCFPSLSVLFQIKSICDEHFDVTGEYIFCHICMSFLSAIYACILMAVSENLSIYFAVCLVGIAVISTSVFVCGKLTCAKRVKNAQKNL